MEETHPVWATVLFLATLVFGPPNTETAMTGVPPVPPALPDLISFTPDPPVQGGQIKICFAFREGDPSPITLEVEWITPSGSSTKSVQVSDTQPCVTIGVPSDATAFLIVDTSGTSADAGGAVSPP